MELKDDIKKQLLSKGSKPSVNDVVDATIDLMKKIEQNYKDGPGPDKKGLVLQNMLIVLQEVDPNLIPFVKETLPNLIDTFVSLNKREFVIKAVQRGLPFCFKLCGKKKR